MIGELVQFILAWDQWLHLFPPDFLPFLRPTGVLLKGNTDLSEPGHALSHIKQVVFLGFCFTAESAAKTLPLKKSTRA